VAVGKLGRDKPHTDRKHIISPKSTRKPEQGSERTATPSKGIGQMSAKKRNMSELAAVGAPSERLTSKREQAPTLNCCQLWK
jgi:hypothetical protein